MNSTSEIPKPIIQPRGVLRVKTIELILSVTEAYECPGSITGGFSADAIRSNSFPWPALYQNVGRFIYRHSAAGAIAPRKGQKKTDGGSISPIFQRRKDSRRKIISRTRLAAVTDVTKNLKRTPLSFSRDRTSSLSTPRPQPTADSPCPESAIAFANAKATAGCVSVVDASRFSHLVFISRLTSNSHASARANTSSRAELGIN
jgi:hypothetical protein